MKDYKFMIGLDRSMFNKEFVTVEQVGSGRILSKLNNVDSNKTIYLKISMKETI